MKNKLFPLFFLFHITLSAIIYPKETPVVNYLKPIELTEMESGIEMIDCIYVINLDKRPEKWNRMKVLLDQQGLQANRVSGIDGWKISKEDQKVLAGPYPQRLRKGQIGCLLSHISVLKDAFERNLNYIWVFEDDVTFVEDIEIIPKLLNDLNSIDPDWDILYTDIDSKNHKGEFIPSLASDFRPDQLHQLKSYSTTRTPITKDLMKIGQRFGMYSVIYSQKGIKKVLDYFTHVYLWTSIDIDVHYIPDVREYSTTRDLVTIWTQSSISDTEMEF